MASLLCHLHFWTLKALAPGTATDSDIGTHVYHDKSAALTEGLLSTTRKEWALGRGITWVPRNKKPVKLRDTLKECEELLSTHQPVTMLWKSLRHCLVLLNNGALITYIVAKHSGDVEKIFLDKSLTTKLGGKIDNALILKRSIVLTTKAESTLVQVYLGQKKVSSSSSHTPLTLTHSDSGRKIEKLANQDLKFCRMEGLPSSEVQRHLVSNSKGDLVVVWWSDTQEGGWTWSSMAHGGAENLLTFSVNNEKLQLCSRVQTDHDPVSMDFSKSRAHILYSVEKAGTSDYMTCTYEYADGKMSKVATGPAFSSSSNIRVCSRNKNERLLLLGCEDGSLILLDTAASKPIVDKKRDFFSSICLIKWHPAGTLAFVCSLTGDLRCYDLALNPVLFQTLSEDPTPSTLLNLPRYFVAPVYLQEAGWGSEPDKGEGHSGCYDNFIMVFGSGPVVLLRLELGVLSRGYLGPGELVAEYIRNKQIDQAVCVLERLNWNLQQNECFSCMTQIFNHLLLQPLTSQTEGQIEAALGTFLHNPNTQSISLKILNRYKPHIIHLQRRFFHLLIMHRKLEKAYEVAKSLQAKDLFMDVHFLAVDLNEPELADSARQKAEDLMSAEPDSSMAWFGLSFPLLAPSPSSSSSQQSKLLPPLSPASAGPTLTSGGAALFQPHYQRLTSGSEEDIKHAPHAASTLSFGEDMGPTLHAFSGLSFEESSYSASPLTQQAIPFDSDRSATPSHSELEDYSDNETTQEGM